jgi:hypothetical protein
VATNPEPVHDSEEILMIFLTTFVGNMIVTFLAKTIFDLHSDSKYTSQTSGQRWLYTTRWVNVFQSAIVLMLTLKTLNDCQPRRDNYIYCIDNPTRMQILVLVYFTSYACCGLAIYFLLIRDFSSSDQIRQVWRRVIEVFGGVTALFFGHFACYFAYANLISEGAVLLI